VLILDEPTLGLDVVNARATFDLIRRWKADGKSIIFSTHIMTEAERLCDDIGIIEKGKLLAQGSPSELLRAYGGRDLEDVFIKLVNVT
jgi:sodium transport system ATP-binding protein